MTASVLYPPSAIPNPQSLSSVRDYVTLLKPGVMSLVVFTGLIGMWLAPGSLHPFLQAIALLCIAAGSGAGGAINMWFDRDIDAIMLRTANRPVPAGRIAPEDALAFGLFLAAFSVMLMGLAVNWLAAFLLAFAIGFYVLVYTMWLKRATPQNIVIGGAAGAFPPVIGWVAITGHLAFAPWILFLIIFLWTPPHFWALALYRNADYTKAGVPMLPVVEGVAATTRQMLLYTLLLIPVAFFPVALGMAGITYAAGSAILGVCFVRHALGVWRDPNDGAARRMFGYSIFYLFALFALLPLDKAIDKIVKLALF